MIEVPEKGNYRQIKDNLLVRLVRYSGDKTFVYVGRVRLNNTVGNVWSVSIEDFWDHYKKVEEKIE